MRIVQTPCKPAELDGHALEAAVGVAANAGPDGTNETMFPNSGCGRLAASTSQKCRL